MEAGTFGEIRALVLWKRSTLGRTQVHTVVRGRRMDGNLRQDLLLVLLEAQSGEAIKLIPKIPLVQRLVINSV